MTNKYIPFIFSLFFSLLFGSCSNANFLSSSYSTSFELIVDYFLEEKETFTREQVDAIPYASALLSFGNKTSSLIILESIKNKNNTWISSDQIRFKESDGRVFQTIGLSNDLYSIERPKIKFEDILEENAISYITYYSFKKPDLNNLKVLVRAQVIGLKTISILGEEKELLLIEEQIFSDRVNWHATNKFWIDPNSSYVWKSIQSISPKLPPLEMTVTKKPAI